MKESWCERGKQRMVADGQRLCQAKTVLLDSEQGNQPEPDELDEEVELREPIRSSHDVVSTGPKYRR